MLGLKLDGWALVSRLPQTDIAKLTHGYEHAVAEVALASARLLDCMLGVGMWYLVAGRTLKHMKATSLCSAAEFAAAGCWLTPGSSAQPLTKRKKTCAEICKGMSLNWLAG